MPKPLDDGIPEFHSELNRGVVPYAKRVGLALSRLQEVEGRRTHIPISELSERLSVILGHVVTRSDFLEYALRDPGDDRVLQAMARLLRVQASWLRSPE